MRMSTFFGVKNFEFFEIYGVSWTDKGVANEKIFWTRGRGVNFLRFCVDVFCGRLFMKKTFEVK